MPLVSIPPPYRGPTGGQAQVEVQGATLAACIDAVGARYPGFSDQIYDPRGKLHRFVKLFVNGDEVGALDTPVEASDQIDILAAIAGG